MKRLAILLLLLASTTQAFVAQTHMHAGFAAQSVAQAVAPQASLLADAAAAGDQQSPAGSGDHTDCLLCQIAAHGVAALAAHQSHVLKVAQQYAVATTLDTNDPVLLPLAHAWLSRGPPRS
jgi:Protein of unknown function (DUF2946)